MTDRAPVPQRSAQKSRAATSRGSQGAPGSVAFSPQAGLALCAATRGARSYRLVVAAIAALAARGEVISLSSLQAEARRLDPAGRRLAQSTILRNPDCYAAYAAARPALPRSRQRRRPVPRALQNARRIDLIEALLQTRVRLREAQACLKSLANENAQLRKRLARDG